MRIQRARQTGQRCGNSKRDELIPRDIDAHGFRCDAVVPDGHDRTARAGIDEVQNDEERDENKYKAQPEGGASRHAGDALCAVDDHIACLVQVQRKRVLQRNMEAGRISADIEGIEQVFDDLTKGQRYDGKIVPLQAQYRNANQKTEQGCGRGPRQQRQRKAKPARHGVPNTHGDKRPHKTAHAHKARMPQAQLAQDAHGEVEGNCHNDICADRNELPRQGICEHAHA